VSRLSGKDIADIARLLDESHFASLDLQMGDFKLRIRRDGGGGNWRDHDEEQDGEEEAVATAASNAPAPAPASPPTLAGAGEQDIIAPLLGNFYAAPRPGEPNFVEVGGTVTPDTTIGIIEVMKLMNPIRAGVSGTVTAVLAQNGKAVEQGQALIRVKVDG
jgi:acetyl-CoA carboxylase biotin carboxyl carrier protein